MKKLFALAAGLLLSLSAFAANPVVEMKTNQGLIIIESGNCRLNRAGVAGKCGCPGQSALRNRVENSGRPRSPRAKRGASGSTSLPLGFYTQGGLTTKPKLPRGSIPGIPVGALAAPS